MTNQNFLVSEFKDTYGCGVDDCPWMKDGPTTCFQFQNYTQCVADEAMAACGEEFKDFVQTKYEIIGDVTMGCETQTPDSTGGHQTVWYYIIGAVFLCAVILALIVAFRFLVRKRRSKSLQRNESNAEKQISIIS